MGRNLTDRLKRLERRAAPPKIIILWPGDPYPAIPESENVVILRVVYTEGRRCQAD